jgi:DNA-3-methyladenine glycosylase
MLPEEIRQRKEAYALKKDFYLGEDVLALSRAFLGKRLVTFFNGQLSSGKIVETEAYRGPDDKACHAHMNRYTERTKIMFEEGGKAYIYLCYGIHHLFNIVTAKEGMPHAILVRAVEPVENTSLMQLRRGIDKLKPQLTAGPGVLSKALGIQKAFSGTDLTREDSPIWIEDRGERVGERAIFASPRVGVDYAEECAAWPWRFRVKDSRWTSPAK